MLNLTHNLWNDEAGFIISAELALISTVCVLGLVVGLSAVRDSVNCELTDLSAAICSLDQSYYYSGFSSRKWPGCCTTKAWTSGSAFYQGCKTCGINGFSDVDFVPTSNVAPCTTCTTAPAVAPTPAVSAPVRILEQPQPVTVPCPPATPAAETVPCPPPVSLPAPAAANCATPVSNCLTPAPVGVSSPAVIHAAPACGAPAPVVHPVLVPQDQLFNW